MAICTLNICSVCFCQKEGREPHATGHAFFSPLPLFSRKTLYTISISGVGLLHSLSVMQSKYCILHQKMDTEFCTDDTATNEAVSLYSVNQK